MNFGEKLFSLRKEKGLAQEALAEQLNTSRQAVSKWENNQGYPETEKLLMLANLFEVSVDYLLKESPSDISSDGQGLYVSRELAAGYLLYSRQVGRSIGLGFCFWILGGIPYTLLPDQTGLRLLGMALCLCIGIGAFVLTVFSENQEYERLEKEPLLFDHAYWKELHTQYQTIRKQCRLLAIPCACILAACILSIWIALERTQSLSFYHSLAFLGIAVTFYALVQSVNRMESYALLAENEAHCRSFWFRLRKAFRQKLDNM